MTGGGFETGGVVGFPLEGGGEVGVDEVPEGGVVVVGGGWFPPELGGGGDPPCAICPVDVVVDVEVGLGGGSAWVICDAQRVYPTGENAWA